jgi:hypothetical protein
LVHRTSARIGSPAGDGGCGGTGSAACGPGW